MTRNSGKVVKNPMASVRFLRYRFSNRMTCDKRTLSFVHGTWNISFWVRHLFGDVDYRVGGSEGVPSRLINMP